MKTMFSFRNNKKCSEAGEPGGDDGHKTAACLLQEKGFVISKQFALKGPRIFIDDVHRLWALAPEEYGKPEVRRFSDILDCRLWESTSRLGTVMRVNIILDDLNHPLLPVGIINYPVTKNSPVYQHRVSCAQDIVSTFLCIKNRCRSDPESGCPTGENVPDAIRKLAGLVQEGLITQEEFQAKKTELLKRM